MKKTVLAVLFAVVAVACSSPNGGPTKSGEPAPVEAKKQALASLPSGYTRTATVISVGPSALDKITEYRVSGPSPIAGKPPVVLLPSANSNFSEYELDDTGDYTQGLAGYLASRGYVVFGLSPRPTGIPDGACEGLTPAVDCSPMLNWDLSAYASDALRVTSDAFADRGVKPVIGGLSMGAITAFAAVSASPSNFSGLIAWEGSLHTSDLTVQAANLTDCQTETANVSSGQGYDNRFGNLTRTAYAAGWPTFRTFFTTPNPAPVGVSDFTLARGNALALTYGTDYRLYHMTFDGNFYDPMPVWRDINCALAGTDTSHTSGLSGFSGPVLEVRSGYGFDSMVHETVALTSSTSVTTIRQADYGHSDMQLSANHRNVIDKPLADWLDATF